MTPDTYSRIALTTHSSKDPDPIQHAWLGMVSELGEIADAYKASLIYGKEFDSTNLLEEVGDFCWFLNLYVVHIGDITFTEVCRHGALPAFHSPVEAIAHSYNRLACLPASDGELKLLRLYGRHLPFSVLPGPLWLLRENGFTLEQAMEANLAKLAKRYPEGFSQFAALNRNKQAELDAIARSGDVV